jgi:hypothetical protein
METLTLLALACLVTPPGDLRFEVTFSPDARTEPLTGRAYVALARESGRRGPISQAGETGVPLFAVNVEGLAAGEVAVIDGEVFGYPVESIDELPPGEYVAQPFFNVYTRFDRADGHTVWLPMDHWEGQQWRRKPGNLRGAPVTVQIDPAAGGVVRLVCDEALPEIPFPEDTEYVKRFRIKSEILSAWWGHDMYIGATVLLPAGYDEHPEARYPVNYSQGHFSTRAPGGFESGRGAFRDWWLGPDAPRFLAVTFQHPTPYYDDSYAVNSENNGPYGDALLQELVPEVERRFRAIGEGWSRLLSGGSTGGWEALALQIFHPDDFGGCWASCPDSVDFRYHQIVNVYEDENAYFLDHGWTRTERPCLRGTDGEVRFTMSQENLYELVVGDRSRSGGQWDIWEATYSPVGPDGYPMPIWDKRTGAIDHGVASYWREHYDLRHILETRWSELGPKLVGKLHVYVGDMDGYYLNNAVGLLETFLESTTDPHYDGEVAYERHAPHCWGPGGRELYEKMAAHLDERAPEGADLSSWRY